MNIPHSYLCPITQDMMEDAMMDTEGNSYSKPAILRWLGTKQTSPLTNQPLTVSDLTPNRTLRSAIEEFMALNGASAGSDDTTQAQQPIQAVPVVALPSPVVKKPNTGELKVAPTRILSDTTNRLINVHTKISIDGSGIATNTDIILAVDVSGSMGGKASNNNDGFTLLDLAKQGVRAVANTLGPNSRMGFVAFNNHATVVLSLTPMDQKGIQLLEHALDKMHPGGQTNIGDAIEEAQELLRKNQRTGVTANVLVLTDGAPNMSPPDGEVCALQQYYDTHGRVASVSTMCFGYSADSELMSSIADTGNGTYGFIPDASLLATVLVHYVANILSIAGTDAQLTVQPLNGARLQFDDTKLNGENRVQKASWGARINVGTIQQGQSRDMMFDVILPDNFQPGTPYAKTTLQYFDVQYGEYQVIEQTVNETEPLPDSMYQQARETFINTVHTASVHGSIHLIDEANKVLNTLADEMKASPLRETDPKYKALYEDLTGQVRLAFANLGDYVRWGKHYILSLSNAHTFQACNNFKDPGLQFYGGLLFKTIRDRADGNVNELPPPKPSGFVGGYSRYGGSSAPTKPISRAQMQQVYNNPNGGCMDTKSSFVSVVCNGKLEHIRLGDLKAGDVVQTHTDEEDTVEAVVIFEGETSVSCLENGLLITDNHPVLVNGSWMHPYSLTTECTTSTTVGSVLLKNRSPTIMVNGTPCATLAHGIENDDVATHDYLGTEKVVEDLQQHPNYETTGRIELPADCFVRSEETGCIVGMKVV